MAVEGQQIGVGDLALTQGAVAMAVARVYASHRFERETPAEAWRLIDLFKSGIASATRRVQFSGRRRVCSPRNSRLYRVCFEG